MQAIGVQTNGRGVDAALNSLADDKLQATVRCLAPHGRLLEIGKYDIFRNTGLGMRPMRDNVAFHGVDLDSILNGGPAEVWAGLGMLFISCCLSLDSFFSNMAVVSAQDKADSFVEILPDILRGA